MLLLRSRLNLQRNDELELTSTQLALDSTSVGWEGAWMTATLRADSSTVTQGHCTFTEIFCPFCPGLSAPCSALANKKERPRGAVVPLNHEFPAVPPQTLE